MLLRRGEYLHDQQVVKVYDLVLVVNEKRLSDVDGLGRFVFAFLILLFISCIEELMIVLFLLLLQVLFLLLLQVL